MKLFVWCIAALALFFPGCGDDSNDASIAQLSEVDKIAHAASTIIVGVKEANRTEGAARARAWELWDLIRGGTPFSTVASQNSDDDSKIDGGFMGFLPTHHDTALAGALQALRPGELSPPVRTAIGYQVLYRHPYDEAVRMEQEKWIAIYGLYFQWGKGARTKEQARDLAERILAQLKAGEITLRDAVAQYGKGTKVPPNGYLGRTANRPARQVLWDAVSPLAEGEYTGPVETNFGWGVLRRGRYLRCVVKHILVQASNNNLRVPRLPAAAKALAEKLHADVLADRSKWSKLVKNHSDDDQSRGDDGLIGAPLTNSSMPDAFEDMVRETEPGSIAPRPVYTDMGWHIIWRLK